MNRYFKQYWKLPKWMMGKDILFAEYSADIQGQCYVHAGYWALPEDVNLRNEIIEWALKFNRSAIHQINAGIVYSHNGLMFQWVVPRKAQTDAEWEAQFKDFYRLLQVVKKEMKDIWTRKGSTCQFYPM